MRTCGAIASLGCMIDLRRTRRAIALVAGTLLAMTLVAGPSPAATTSPAVARDRTVTVGGDVQTPASYTPDQLRTRPQVTVPSGAGPVTGVSLQELVAESTPTTPADAKNPQLRVAVTVSGASGQRVTLALGELDPGFGNRPALLTLSRDGRADLVLPGDSWGVRRVIGVQSIQARVFAPEPGSAAGDGLQIAVDGKRSVRVPRWLLAVLPARRLTVSYQSGSGPQTHTEYGPDLSTVLLAAGVVPTCRTAVAASATDGYLAVVTPCEAWSAGADLVVSLKEDGQRLDRPRLVVNGDVRGGRYVSGLTTLRVTR